MKRTILALFGSTLPRTARIVLLADVVLLVTFLLSFWSVWHSLPTEGVKLHANIDTGIDIFGQRKELFWLFGIAVSTVVGNTLLAKTLRQSQPLAAGLFLGSTVPLLVGFLGALLFIARLNVSP